MYFEQFTSGAGQCAGCDVLSWRIQRTGSEIIWNDGFQKLLPGIPACVNTKEKKNAD